MSLKVGALFVLLLGLLFLSGYVSHYAASGALHSFFHKKTPWTRLFYDTERSALESMAKRAAHLHQVDAALFLSLIRHESAWRVNAVSHKGAVGLTQLMPATAAEECNLRPEALTHPALNLDCGARYLAKQLRRFGDVQKALCAYNAGPELTARLGRCPNYRETRRYVKAVMRDRESLRKRCGALCGFL